MLSIVSIMIQSERLASPSVPSIPKMAIFFMSVLFGIVFCISEAELSDEFSESDYVSASELFGVLLSSKVTLLILFRYLFSVNAEAADMPNTKNSNASKKRFIYFLDLLFLSFEFWITLFLDNLILPLLLFIQVYSVNN